MTFDPAMITALAGAASALGALLTAIHAHGKATNASQSANQAAVTAEASAYKVFSQLHSDSFSKALDKIYSAGLQQLVATGLPVSASDSGLISWLREQHKAVTGSYPAPGGPTTDFSRVIDWLAAK